MSVNRLLNAIETLFKAELNTAKTCEQFPGPFTVQAIVDQSFSSPAAFTGCNGMQDPRPQDEQMLNQYGVVKAARFTTVTVGKHAKSLVNANREAMLLAEQISALLYKQNFGQDYASRAYNVRAEAMAAGKEKAGHLMFWRVTWWHGMGINAEAIEATLPLANFEGYDADHFTADADTQTDTPKMQSSEDYT